LIYKNFSAIEKCPDCQQDTLRVFWFQINDDAPTRTDEFCDHPSCTRGDLSGIRRPKNA